MRQRSLLLLWVSALLTIGPVQAQSNPGASQPAGDVFSSRGAPDDRRKYVSPDGRNFDRCSYETAHMSDFPDTRLYGPPDHVPIDREIMSQYARCAVDSCAVNQKAVCWGKKIRENSAMPASPDSFNTNGYTNCQADGVAVVCDAPPQQTALPAPCVSDPQLVCEKKVVFKLYGKVNVAGTSTNYYQNYGQTLPAMTGQTTFGPSTIYVDTPAGFRVGQGLAGPVKVRSTPARFSTAAGYIDPTTTNVFVMTDLRDLSGRPVLTPGQALRVWLRTKR